jgi:hypothetical protein
MSFGPSGMMKTQTVRLAILKYVSGWKVKAVRKNTSNVLIPWPRISMSNLHQQQDFEQAEALKTQKNHNLCGYDCSFSLWAA